VKIKIFHPGVEAQGGEPAAASAPAAQVPSAGFAGKLRVALLDNTKVNSIELMDAIARKLEGKLQGKLPVEIRRWRKRHAGESGAVVIGELMGWQPHLVLTGLGD